MNTGSISQEFMEGRLVGGKRSERQSPPVPRPFPWLVFPHGKGSKDQAFFNLCDPNNKTYLKSIPEMRHKSFWQSPSHKGWLVMLCDDDESSNSNWKSGDCFLWNPVTLETIQLPSLLFWLNKLDQYYISTCVLTSPPKSNNNLSDDDDGFMVSFHFIGEKNVLVFCFRGDKQWSEHELYEIQKDDSSYKLLSFKDKLFLVSYDNRLLKIENLVSDGDEKSLVVKSFDLRDDTPQVNIGSSSAGSRHYRVESSDELFQVIVTSYDIGCHDQVVQIEVSRLDFSLMAWKEVKSLGDHVLFISENTTASCSAAKLGLTRGLLYYMLPEEKSLCTFDLENSSIFVSLPCPKLPTPWFPPSWMIIPTIVSVADGRRAECEFCNDEDKANIIEAKENKTCTNNDDKEDLGQIKNGGGALEETRTYAVLYEDLLKLVASYLHPVDYIHFRTVSKANRLACPVMDWRTTIGIVQTTLLSPWLVFSTHTGTIYNFVDPMHNNEKYHMNLPEILFGATIRFSKGGWLLMSKGCNKSNTLFFYNPFTRATIKLPDITLRDIRDVNIPPVESRYLYSGISFSSTPTSSDCVVFAFIRDIFHNIFTFVIERGEDRWRITTNTDLTTNRNCMDFNPCLNNPVFHDGAFYCLDCNGALGVFNLEDGFSLLANPQPPCNSIYKCFLVECEGKLLSVFLGHMGKWVSIFRLDFSKMVWVKVESLGKHMLFISNTSCLSAAATDSRMENKIFFPRLHGEGILFYSLDTCMYQSIESQYSGQDFYNTEEKLYCSWIEPCWSQATDQELDWLSI